MLDITLIPRLAAPDAATKIDNDVNIGFGDLDIDIVGVLF